jgi:hypothetical protein
MTFALTIIAIIVAFIRLGSRVIAWACRDDPDEQVPDEAPNGDHVQLPPGFLRHVHNGGV